MYKRARNTRLRAKVWAENCLDIYSRTVQIYKAQKKHQETSLPYKTIYVCFRGGVRAQWQRFLDYRFTHVFMLSDVVDQKFGTGLLQTEFLYAYLKELKKAGVLIVKVKPGSRKKFLGKLWPGVLPYNCVSLVKHYVGIKKPFVLTPKQLYKHLALENAMGEQHG
jgi:hypothetical protein